MAVVAATLVLGCVYLVMTGVGSSDRHDEGEPARVYERDRDNDGVMDMRLETQRRNGSRAFLSLRDRKPAGTWSESRSYFVGGADVAAEFDSDGDGFFETLVVYGAGESDLEAFERSTDGSVSIAPENVRRFHIDQRRAMSRHWSEALPAR